MRLGYFLSSEEHPPEELVRQAGLAEQAGFESLWISDHFHPWNDEQGQSPFVWSVIGALSGVTSLPVTTAVTCPTVRTHPAVVAQAVATSARLLPGGLHFGVGTGEALNEHVVGQRWPTTDVRLEMLEEAIDVIRRLLTGERVDHHGTHYVVEDARLYTLPEQPVPILISGFGAKAIELAARTGDGLVTTKPEGADVEAYRANGGRGPVEAGVKVCWGQSEDTAAELAHRLWATQGLPGELSQVLPSPRHFEQGAQLVDVEDTRKAIACGPDPQRYVDVIQQYAEAGVDVLHLAQIGPDQEGFFEFFNDQVRPQPRLAHLSFPIGRLLGVRVSRPLLMSVLDRPVEWQWLDPTAEKVKGLVEFVLPRGRVRDLLHGKAVGHPAHPPLAQAVLAGWTGAAVLGVAELVSGPASRDDASARPLLSLIGLATAGPTVAAGLSDWSQLHEDQQRTGLVHAVVMSASRLGQRGRAPHQESTPLGVAGPGRGRGRHTGCCSRRSSGLSMVGRAESRRSVPPPGQGGMDAHLPR